MATRWEQIRRYSLRAGKEVLAVAEACYKTMLDPALSVTQKSLILGAIAYLLLPVDVYPDFLPGGYADDMSVMLGALYSAGKVGKKHLSECRLKHGLATIDKDSP